MSIFLVSNAIYSFIINLVVPSSTAWTLTLALLLQFCIGTIKDDFLGVISDPGATSWMETRAYLGSSQVQLHEWKPGLILDLHTHPLVITFSILCYRELWFERKEMFMVWGNVCESLFKLNGLSALMKLHVQWSLSFNKAHTLLCKWEAKILVYRTKYIRHGICARLGLYECYIWKTAIWCAKYFYWVFPLCMLMSFWGCLKLL